MTRVPVLGPGDKIDQKHLPVHLDPATMTESTQDIVAALMVAGVGITFSYNDAGNQLVINSTDGGGGGGTVSAEDLRSSDANAFYSNDIGNYPMRVSVTSDPLRRVRWIGPVAPAISDDYATANFDVWETTAVSTPGADEPDSLDGGSPADPGGSDGTDGGTP